MRGWLVHALKSHPLDCRDKACLVSTISILPFGEFHQVSLDKAINVANHDPLDIGGCETGPNIFHQFVRLHCILADLRSPLYFFEASRLDYTPNLLPISPSKKNQEQEHGKNNIFDKKSGCRTYTSYRVAMEQERRPLRILFCLICWIAMSL